MEDTNSAGPTPFGYEILRDHVMPDILGKHEEEIMYWAGKEVARKFPVFSFDELPVFFKEAGWGSLALNKTIKDEAHYTLTLHTGTNSQNRTYTMEAGFLAEQYQSLNSVLTECYGEINRKTNTCQFTVRWDSKTVIAK